MTRHALIVGINLYNDLHPLEKPASDAEAMAQLLETIGHFKVTRLPTRNQKEIDKHGVVHFPQLKAAISQLFVPQTETQLPDTALLFFAGHGWRDIDEAGITAGYLATSETNKNKHLYGISLDWLKKVLKKSQIKQQIVWLDCCHSGELLNFDEAYEEPEIGHGRCFIAASLDYQVAYESITSEHGILTEALLKGLNSRTAIDNYVLTDFVQHYLKSAPQQPVIRNVGSRILLTQQATETKKVQSQGVCPYKGLESFKETDAHYFFGRENLTDELIEKVRTSNFLAVLGVSGSGKSSVVRAGLLHQLKLGKKLGESQHWHFYPPFTPAQNGNTPLKNLAQALVAEDLPKATRRKELENTEYFLEKGTTGLQQLVKEENVTRAILVIDQFEELFTRCEEEDRQQFLACILGCLPAPNAPVSDLCVIITMRADFLGKCAEQEYSNLTGYIDAHQITVRPMNGSELKAAIVRPAEAVGLNIEAELVMAMLKDIEGPGSLPLLQYTLTELWQRRDMNQLILAEYVRLGGVQGTLQQSADKAYSELSEDEQAVARWIFLGLTQLGEGTEDTRKQVFKTELVTAHYSATLIDQVLDKLATVRLVVIDSLAGRSDESTPVTVVDVAHEALIRHWQRLRLWLNDNRHALAKKRDIENAAKEWDTHKQVKGYLLQGPKLGVAEEYIKQEADDIPLSELAYSFVRKSVRHWQVQNYSLVAVVMVVILVLGGFGFYANQQRILADEQRIEANKQKEEADIARDKAKESEQIAFVEKLAAQSTLATQLPNKSNGYYEHALLLAVQAFREKDTTTTRSNLLRVLQSQQQRKQFWYGHSGFVTSVVFSSDGKTLASSSWDNTIRLWDVATGQAKTLNGHSSWVYSVAFSPNGKTLASGSHDKTVKLWDVATGQAKTLHGHSSWVSSVAFSPDGKTIASGSGDYTIRLWDVATGQAKILSGHSSYVNSVVFSPDGKTLASGSEDNTIRLWDVATKQTLGRPFIDHSNKVSRVVFSPDGKLLASGSGDNTIRLWDVATGKALEQPLRGHSDFVRSVVFSPDGKILASGSSDYTIRLWDVATGKPLGQPLVGHSGAINSVAFSPDSKILASGGWYGTIRLWNVTMRQTLGQALSGHSGTVKSVVFSPDGKTLASASNDRTIRLWDVATGQSQPLSGHSDYVFSVAFSPDGKTLASGSNDKTIRLWDVATGKALHKPLAGHSFSVGSVVFSPDGKTLASGSSDRTIRLWDITMGQALGQPLSGHSSSVFSVTFSPDGKKLASGSADKTIRLWDVDPESWAKKACTIVNRNFSHKEWQKYMGNRPHEKTCPDLPKDTLGAIELAAEARNLLNPTRYINGKIHEPTKDEIEQAKAKFKQAREWDERMVWGDEGLEY